jgi:hypothetical protein
MGEMLLSCMMTFLTACMISKWEVGHEEHVVI